MRISFSADPRQCAYAKCDKWFEPIHPAQKYCDLTCKQRAANAIQNAKYKTAHPVQERLCAGCNEWFTPKSSQARYCTDQCRRRESARRERDRKLAKAHASNQPIPRLKLPVEPDTPPAEGGPYYRLYDGEERRLHWIPVPTELELEDPAESTESKSWHDVLDIWLEYA